MYNVLKIFVILCLLFPISSFAGSIINGQDTSNFITSPSGETVNITDGNLDVMIGDQTSPPLAIFLSRELYQPSLTAPTTVGATTIVVDVADGFVAGAHIMIADSASGRYYVGHQVGAIATLTVTVDTPLDFAFPVATTDMAINKDINHE